MTLWGLAIQTVAGLLGAHAAASVPHEHRFGFIGRSVSGLVGGALAAHSFRRRRHHRDGQRKPESIARLRSLSVAGAILTLAVGS